MKEATCCFIGHRKIKESKELSRKLYSSIESLILNEKVDTFLFGSKSQFNDLCYKIVTVLKEKYPYIKRIYVRAEFPYIDDKYKNYLLTRYEHTYFPEKIKNAGKATYIERNYEMIDKSGFCVIYYNKNYSPQKKGELYRISKSGTQLAYAYAEKKCLWVKNVLFDA